MVVLSTIPNCVPVCIISEFVECIILQVDTTPQQQLKSSFFALLNSLKSDWLVPIKALVSRILSVSSQCVEEAKHLYEFSTFSKMANSHMRSFLYSLLQQQ